MKSQVITFKAEDSLAELINRLPNKSEFIRRAILNSLENSCPLCLGSGILSADQKKHWASFSEHHHIEECNDCHAVHLHCDHDVSEAHTK